MFHISLQVVDEKSKIFISSGELQILTFWNKFQRISDVQSISITADIFPGEPSSFLMLHSQLSIGISDLIKWKGQHN